MYENAFYIRQSFECGASGYVFKSDSPEKLLQVIEKVQEGKHYLPPNILDEYINLATIYTSFSPKETAVADSILLGLSNKEIAKKMNVSVRTIKNYLSNMYDKSFTKNRDELICTLSGAFQEPGSGKTV